MKSKRKIVPTEELASKGKRQKKNQPGTIYESNGPKEVKIKVRRKYFPNDRDKTMKTVLSMYRGSKIMDDLVGLLMPIYNLPS